MSSRWKKVWADFWGNKVRTVLMVLTITVGVFAVGFVSNMAVMVNRDMDADYQSANPSEAIIYTSMIDDDLVERLQKVPGVGGLEGRSTISAFVILPSGKRINTQFNSLKSFDAHKVNIIKPEDPGGVLPELHEKEFWLDRSTRTLGLKPGEMVSIELADGTIRELRFGGYVHSVAIFPYNIVSTATGYLATETMLWMGGSEYYDQVVLSVAENPTDLRHVTQVSQAVGDRIKKSGQFVGVISTYNPGHHFAWYITQGIIFILSALGWLTVLLGAILIINSITALVSQQTRQIGIMKSIGADTGQVLFMYMVLVLGLGLLALAISVPLSSSSAYRIASGMARFLNFDSGPMTFDRGVIVQQVIVSIIVPVVAALLPILNNTRITVREALSNYGIGNEPAKGKKKKEAVDKRFIGLPRPMRISFRNAFRRRTRLALTLIALVLGGGIFISVMNLWASFDRTIDNVGGYFLADINVTFNRYHRYDKVNSIALTIPGVVATEGWLGGGGKLFVEGDEEGTNIVFNAPPPDSRLIRPIITEGRWLVPGDENALVIGNHLLNARPDLKVGDWVTLEIDGKKTSWQIVGIFRMPGNTAPPPVYVPYGYYAYLKGINGQAYSLRILTDKHDHESQAALGKQLEATFKANGIQLAFMQLGTDWAQSQRASTDILAYFMMVMAILIAIVGGLGLMGTMSINVLERTREIGVMRAIGASNWDIQAIVIAEGAAIGLISWVFAMLVAIPLTSVLDVGVGTALLQAPIPYIFGLTGSLTWLIGILVIAAIASALPARSASRLTVKDTLAYE